MKEEAIVIGFVVALVLALAVVCGSCERYKCEHIGDIIGHPAKLEFGGVCFVNVDGQWIPYERWVHVK